MAGAELIGKEELKEIEVLFKTGIFARYSLDKERQGIWKVRDFEKAFTKYFGAKYALAVSSGSCALKIALTALDVGPGDEVICPAFTFMATYEAVLEVGAMPVMADIDDTLNLDPDDIPEQDHAADQGDHSRPHVRRAGADGQDHEGGQEAQAPGPGGQRPGLRGEHQGEDDGHHRAYGDLQLRPLQDDHHRRGRHDPHRRPGPLPPRRMVPRPRPRPPLHGPAGPSTAGRSSVSTTG